jgi:hypothetical protein
MTNPEVLAVKREPTAMLKLADELSMHQTINESRVDAIERIFKPTPKRF